MIFPQSYLLKVFVAFTISPLYSYFARNVRTFNDVNLINTYYNNLYDFSFIRADSLVLLISKSGIDSSSINNLKANLLWSKLISGDFTDLNIRNGNYYIDESIRFNLKKKQQDLNSLLNLIYSYSLSARLENFNDNTLYI
jgi:hypothetical protein